MVTERDCQDSGVVLRFATAADADRLQTLAQLDSARLPGGRVLVAEVDGRLQAAISLDGGAPIADPFRRTADVVVLLRARAAQLTGRGPQLTGRDGRGATSLSALERRSADLRSAKPFAALRRLA